MGETLPYYGGYANGLYGSSSPYAGLNTGLNANGVLMNDEGLNGVYGNTSALNGLNGLGYSPNYGSTYGSTYAPNYASTYPYGYGQTYGANGVLPGVTQAVLPTTTTTNLVATPTVTTTTIPTTTTTTNTGTISPNSLASLALSFQGMKTGNMVMPSLSVVSSAMQQMFGPGPYSSYPSSLMALIGTWSVQQQYPSASNSYVVLSAYVPPGSAAAQTGTILGMSSTASQTITDLVITDQTGSLVQGYLSIQPQEYLIYTPFPSTSVSSPAYFPVAGIGLAQSNSAISFIMFAQANQSYWSRVSNATPSNTSISSSLQLSGGNLPVGYATGSPAQYAAQLGLTPQALAQTQSNAVNTANGQYLSPQAFFNYTPNGVLQNYLPAAGNASLTSTIAPPVQAQLSSVAGLNGLNNGVVLPTQPVNSFNGLNNGFVRANGLNGMTNGLTVPGSLMRVWTKIVIDLDAALVQSAEKHHLNNEKTLSIKKIVFMYGQVKYPCLCSGSPSSQDELIYTDSRGKRYHLCEYKLVHDCLRSPTSMHCNESCFGVKFVVINCFHEIDSIDWTEHDRVECIGLLDQFCRRHYGLGLWTNPSFHVCVARVDVHPKVDVCPKVHHLQSSESKRLMKALRIALDEHICGRKQGTTEITIPYANAYGDQGYILQMHNAIVVPFLRRHLNLDWHYLNLGPFRYKRDGDETASTKDMHICLSDDMKRRQEWSRVVLDELEQCGMACGDLWFGSS